MTLLDAAKDWARERGYGFRCSWSAKRQRHELVVHFGREAGEPLDLQIAWVEGKNRLDVRSTAKVGMHRARTPLGVRKLLTSLVSQYEKQLCNSPRHTEGGCPACDLVRRGGMKPRLEEKPAAREVLPPDPPPPVLTRKGPQTVEEAEAELERLMRDNASPATLRAAGARLDALLDARPVN